MLYIGKPRVYDVDFSFWYPHRKERRLPMLVLRTPLPLWTELYDAYFRSTAFGRFCIREQVDGRPFVVLVKGKPRLGKNTLDIGAARECNLIRGLDFDLRYDIFYDLDELLDAIFTSFNTRWNVKRDYTYHNVILSEGQGSEGKEHHAEDKKTRWKKLLGLRGEKHVNIWIDSTSKDDYEYLKSSAACIINFERRGAGDYITIHDPYWKSSIDTFDTYKTFYPPPLCTELDYYYELTEKPAKKQLAAEEIAEHHLRVAAAQAKRQLAIARAARLAAGIPEPKKSHHAHKMDTAPIGEVAPAQGDGYSSGAGDLSRQREPRDSVERENNTSSTARG